MHPKITAGLSVWTAGNHGTVRRSESDFGRRALLICELDAKFGLLEQFAEGSDDCRSPVFTVHSLRERWSQRIFGIALGYENFNDHDPLPHDPWMAGMTDLPSKEGISFAGKRTLNR